MKIWLICRFIKKNIVKNLRMSLKLDFEDKQIMAMQTFINLSIYVFI